MKKSALITGITGQEMVEEDYKAARRLALLKEHNLDLPVSIES